VVNDRVEDAIAQVIRIMDAPQERIPHQST
jgi:hypothetical protein